MPFTDFVNQYRITQSKTLLLQGMRVSEACYEVGFESLSYFNKLFKRLAGENPSQFRKRYIKGRLFIYGQATFYFNRGSTIILRILQGGFFLYLNAI